MKKLTDFKPSGASSKKPLTEAQHDDLSERFIRRCGENDITSAERAAILKLISDGVTADVCKALKIVRSRRRK